MDRTQERIKELEQKIVEQDAAAQQQEQDLNPRRSEFGLDPNKFPEGSVERELKAGYMADHPKESNIETEPPKKEWSLSNKWPEGSSEQELKAGYMADQAAHKRARSF